MTKRFDIIFWALFMLVPLNTALADSVKLESMTKECVVGEALEFTIAVETDEEKKIEVRGATYQGKPISYQVSNSRSGSFSLTINGKVVRQSSGTTKNYTFQIPTDKVGPLTLPAFQILIDDTPYTIDEMVFDVKPKPTSENLRFKTIIENSQPYYYPTQVINIQCILYFRSFPGSPSVENISLPFLKERALQAIPNEKSNFDIVINNERTRILQDYGKAVVDGKSYTTFQFDLKFRLMAPGEFTFNSFAKLQVETGRTIQRQGFFGPSLVRERTALFANSNPLTLHVKTLPEDNVPVSFNGAIGEFKINVIPDRTDVKVGDPITLSIEITGRGTWEFVKAPPLHKFPEITDYFFVGTDPVAGDVSADKTRKTFLVPLRVKSKTVTQIPEIPFTYFNLATQKYMTTRSKAVPIKVFDATSRIEVVDFSKAKSPQPPSSDQKATPAKADKGENGKKELPPPEMPELIQIDDNVAGSLLRENHTPQYVRIVYALLPLVFALLMFIILRIKKHNPSADKIKKDKQRNAYKIFKEEVAHLQKEVVNDTTFFRDLGNAIETFLENRFALLPDEREMEILEEKLATFELDPQLIGELQSLMERINHHRYSGVAFDPSIAKELLSETMIVLEKC